MESAPNRQPGKAALRLPRFYCEGGFDDIQRVVGTGSGKDHIHRPAIPAHPFARECETEF